MKNFILILTFITILTSSLTGQISQQNYQSSILELGLGTGAYDDVNTQQIMVFIKTPYLNGKIDQLEYSGKLNFELIDESDHSILLIGFVPMLKYNFQIEDITLFLRGGIGVNYINSNQVGSRNLGGNFIFSDMIGVGIKLFQYYDYGIEISYLFRHISNAGFYRDNEGYNSQYLLLTLII